MVDNTRDGTGVLGGEVSNVGIHWRVDQVVVVVSWVVSWVVSRVVSWVVSWVVSALSLKDTVRR